MLKINSPFVKFYEIPNDRLYVESFTFRAGNEVPFKEVEGIDHSKTTAVVFTESLFLHNVSMFLVYDGKIQTTGGGGSCYNPRHREAKTKEYITESIGSYFSNDHIFSAQAIFEKIAYVKWSLLKNLKGESEYIPWLWSLEEYRSGMFGILIGKFDAIGMGKSVTLIEETKKQLKLLPAPKAA